MRLEVKQTEAFREWLAALDDKVGKLAIVSRLDRLSFGLFGDVEPIGEGLSELRIHVGPGYRVYVMQRGKVLVIVLAAGIKRTQRRDIKAARALAGEIREKNGWSS